jgi:hypothetical protein
MPGGAGAGFEGYGRAAYPRVAALLNGASILTLPVKYCSWPFADRCDPLRVISISAVLSASSNLVVAAAMSNISRIAIPPATNVMTLTDQASSFLRVVGAERSSPIRLRLNQPPAAYR